MKKRVILLGIIIATIAIVGVLLAFSVQATKEKREVFTIGLDDSFPPMGFRDENNELTGFDVEVAKKVAEKLEMDFKVQPISWAAKEQELDSGNIDCIWNGFALTEERKETMTLTDVYVKGGTIFIVNPDSTYVKQEDLIGKKVGVQNGSSQQQDFENSEFGKSLGEVVKYGDYLTALMDLETGRIDAVYMSRISGNYIIKSKQKNFRTFDSEGINMSQGMVVAFKKGNTVLRDKVQKALYELKREGILKEISEKWFGEDIILVKDK